MSFASPVFLWCFMPGVLLMYWLMPARHRNAVLAVASLLFYAYGAKGQVVLLLTCIAVNYASGIVIDRHIDDRVRNGVLAATIVADVGVLVFWKYGGFFSQQAHNIADLLGGNGTSVLGVALPIGISFYTFHLLSYVIDVWRRRSAALHRPLDFVTYIAMFPQLIAGPIVRYHEISDQLEDVRARRADDFADGFPRFALGLAKKVIVADALGPVADAAFARSSHPTTASAWIGVLAYTLQIYFDFSGYTDMAIGLARMFGFRFPENFNRPYSSVSMTDFWRRWHMSLSRWFRDYVYIPLGGNHGTERQTYRNLVVVFLLTGLWHGAAWTFVLWGAYHGALLILERRNPRRREPEGVDASRSIGPIVGARARTLLLVMVGWVLFRAPDLSHALSMYRAMIWPSGLSLDLATDLALTRERTVILLAASTVFLLPRSFVFGRFLDHGQSSTARLSRLAVCAILPVSALLVAVGSFSPFLYYQF